MRRFQKKQYIEIIKTMEEAHVEICRYIEKKELSRVFNLLRDCQDAAIAMGNEIEVSEGKTTEGVVELEDYCEFLSIINEEMQKDSANSNPQKTTKQLKKKLTRVKNRINALPVRLEVVFLPYKASMWDSLESIYRAAEADLDCDAYCVPIPYFDKNPDGTFGKSHYEGDLYPSDIRVVSYTSYSLEDHHPDIIFFHNPYDANNYVTSVHPDYYSKKLKQYTDCLVYVPYYATSGNMSEAQSILLSYFYSDYIVVQSKAMIDFFDERIPREKFLPFGSPKFDRVIKLCSNPPEAPKEWQEKLKGRKVFFYNTSIDGFLRDTSAFLKKVAYVLNTFKDRDDVCLLWRPHPLLESTIDSMRLEARPEYEKLKKYFIEENIGIFDETPDIEKSIAFSDAYIGDAGTSVTSLFGVVGKPIYILNNYIHEAPGKDDWKSYTSPVVRSDRNNRYWIDKWNRLFKDENHDKHYQYLCDLSDDYRGGKCYGQALEAEGKIVAFPVNAEQILVINPENLSKKKINLRHKIEGNGAFAGATNLIPSEHPEIFYILPDCYPELVKFNARTEKTDYISDEAFSDQFGVYQNGSERVRSVRFLIGDRDFIFLTEKTRHLLNRDEFQKNQFPEPDGTVHNYFWRDVPEIPGITLKGSLLLWIDVTGKRMRVINLETKEVQEREMGLDGLYIAACWNFLDLDHIWFIPYKGTELCKWSVSTDTFEKVNVYVDGLMSIHRPERYICDEHYFSSGIFYKDSIILSPNWGNKFVELNMRTNKAKEWIPPFSFTLEDKNRYWKNNGIGFFYQDIFDLSYLFYYSPDRIIYNIDMENHTSKIVDTSFERNDIFEMALGFHRASQGMPYCCLEDVFNSLEDILNGKIHGSDYKYEQQIQAYNMINANPAGNCGNKVYGFLKEQLINS